MSNIYNSKSGIFESSEVQSEMQSCKLDESESKPNITLKKMGQELDKAETKCSTLKSELNYVIEVCQKVKSEMKSNKEKSDISLEPTESSAENPSLKFLVEHKDYSSENMATDKIPQYNLQRIYNIEHKIEDFDASHLSSKSARLSSREIVDNDNIIEKSESLKQQKQNGLSSVTIIPKTQLDKRLPIAMTTMPLQNEILRASREYENRSSYFPEYVQEHVQSMLNVKGSIEELTSKANEENIFRVILPNSVKRDIRDTEFNMNIPDTAKIKRAEKSKRVSRMERSESNSIYKKTNDMLSKVRKRKARLRSSVSKSTIATKDTSHVISRKEVKRRKHRGQGIIHQQSTLSKKLSKKSSDVVDIFHNTTLKSSNSGISNRHPKFDKRTKCVKNQLVETDDKKLEETSYPKRPNVDEFENNENEQPNQCSQSNYQYNSGIIPKKIEEHDKLEKHSNDLYPTTQYKTQCEHNAFNRCNDPMFSPNYEMPTLASRLKRSNRSYFNRFNFRNIPFVVGTSVTPSHNLGLNIQQVLSAMKTRQPNDIAPLLLMHKINNKDMKSMSLLLEQINSRSQSERSVLNINSHLTGICNNDENSNINRDKKLSVFDLQHVKNARTLNASGNTKMVPEKDNNLINQFNKEKIDYKIKPQSHTIINKNSTLVNVRNQQGVLKVSSNKETNIGDYKMHTITGTHNSKEIRDILINLHDQFEEMNTKCEKLQLEMEKSNDKSLAEELSVVEKELNVKEEEINAVIGLYKEVMMLKQQMKMMHDKNSLVCITTESAKGFHKNFPISILPGKSHSLNPTQIFGRRKFNTTREPPASMQLTALLRQIQNFHKQMQLVL